MKRRTLDFHSANDVIEDIKLLQSRGYDRVGNWNLTQACQHLLVTTNGGMDGFGFRLPWILRATVVRLIFNSILKRRKMISSAPTMKSLKPTHSSLTEDDSIIDAYLASCRRAEAFEGPMTDYPLVDNLSVEDWRDFMWIHAAHHMSFLVPKEIASS